MWYQISEIHFTAYDARPFNRLFPRAPKVDASRLVDRRGTAARPKFVVRRRRIHGSHRAQSAAVSALLLRVAGWRSRHIRHEKDLRCRHQSMWAVDLTGRHVGPVLRRRSHPPCRGHDPGRRASRTNCLAVSTLSHQSRSTAEPFGRQASDRSAPALLSRLAPRPGSAVPAPTLAHRRLTYRR